MSNNHDLPIELRLEKVLASLQELAHPDQVAGMERFGMSAEGRLGISMPELRKLAKETGRDHDLAIALWQAGIPEARIVASLLADPLELTENQMEAWVSEFNSWDVCDQVCMNLFEKSPFAWQKIRQWSLRDEQFVKRAAYALLACLAWHDKQAPDEKFIELFSVIQQGASDGRNFVKKAVNWALRNIGKRNLPLNQAAIQLAENLLKTVSPTARWIAVDAMRELQSRAVQDRLRKK
jgi:3-methyladenine DNA glycosylase AlkD